MIELSTIRDLVAIFGVIAGFSYYVLTVRATKKNQEQQLVTRQAQLFSNIYSQLTSNEAIQNEFEIMNLELKTAKEFIELYNDKTKYTAFNWYLAFYEGIGVLVRQNLVDIELVSLMLSGQIIWFWERYRDLFLDFRVHMNWPRAMIECEYLYNRVKEYMEESHPSSHITSPVLMGQSSQRITT